MKSLRLDDELAERLASCARADGVSESEFIRRAIQQAVDSAEPIEIPEDLKGIIGVGRLGLGGTASRRTGELFTEMLWEDHRRKQRRDAR
jgi:negative regulator of replication initiation